MTIATDLTELVVRENILYESLRSQNLDGSIRTEERPVQAVAVGNPRIFSAPNNSSRDMIYSALSKIEPPKKANAYVLGNSIGEQFPDGCWPMPVQFYYKL